MMREKLAPHFKWGIIILLPRIFIGSAKGGLALPLVLVTSLGDSFTYWFLQVYRSPFAPEYSFRLSLHSHSLLLPHNSLVSIGAVPHFVLFSECLSKNIRTLFPLRYDINSKTLRLWCSCEPTPLSLEVFILVPWAMLRLIPFSSSQLGIKIRFHLH